MIETIIDIIKFITYIPFEQNFFFPSIILVIFVLSLIQNYLQHQKMFNEYSNNIDNFVLDDWLDITSFKSVAGILMSIGIIGTFYLIYESLSHFDIDNTKETSKMITSNIAPAFSISAFGILMSIFYISFEKLLLLYTYTIKMEDLKSSKKTKTYVDFATQEEQISREILQEIKIQTKTFESLGNFAEGLESMSVSMEKFGKIADNLEDTLNPEKLGAIISKAITTEMTPILNNIEKINLKVSSNSQKITEFLEEDLKNEIILPLKNAVISTDKSMIEMREVLEKTSDVMNETSKGIEKISENLSKLETSQTEFVLNLDNVLDKQKREFENTTQIIERTYTQLNSSVSNQTEQFEKNSHIILKSFTTLSMEMQGFLREYKEDYKVILEEQQKAIVETKDSAVEILDKSGKQASTLITEASTTLNSTLSNVNETLVSTSEKAGQILDKSGQGVADVINMASENLNSTLSGVDEALVKTSQSIQEELEKFRDSYTEKVSEFLGKQVDVLEVVIGKQTEKLESVVNSFKENLETDVDNRKLLNEELDKLVKRTAGFVASTEATIATAFNEQKSQLSSFLQTNQKMQKELEYIIDNASDINENGNVLTKDLITTTGDLMNQFTKNQKEVLKEYQGKVDEHLKSILGAMLAIIEVSHTTKD